MIRASITRRTSDGTIAAAAYELIAPAARGIMLYEMMVTLASAATSTFGLGRPAAKGLVPTGPVTLLLESGTDAPSQTGTAIAWGTGPTVPANFFRRVSFPATIASFILWTFPKGIFIRAGETVVLWNIAASGVADVSAVIEEPPL
jgi:hypothetical protein